MSTVKQIITWPTKINLVYCRDCKYCYQQTVCLTSLPPQYKTHYWCHYYDTVHVVESTDFCSKGKIKTSEDGCISND